MAAFSAAACSDLFVPAGAEAVAERSKLLNKIFVAFFLLNKARVEKFVAFQFPF
jgi:F0F1-type ATP synthase membrane subunit c/vacuolar-type H+-ATPase subunit K